jgi:hypothetical protein
MVRRHTLSQTHTHTNTISHARTTTPTHTHNISPTLSQNDGASVCFGVKVHWDGKEEDVESKKKNIDEVFLCNK